MPASVCGLLNMDYKELEAIYVNDGSKDKTLGVLNDMLHPNKYFKTIRIHTVLKRFIDQANTQTFMIDKQNGGRVSGAERGRLFCLLRINYYPRCRQRKQNDALHYMNNAFEDSDVVAAGGAIHIMQGYDACIWETS